MRPPRCAAVVYAALPLFAIAAPVAETTTSTPSTYRPPATCSTPQADPAVEGHPHVTSVPKLVSVSITTERRGLEALYHFRAPLVPAPEGVYISWTIFLYRSRSDVSSSTRSLQLLVEDRGTGWEPTGWAIVVSSYSDESPVAGPVITDRARDKLSVYFPPGFVNLSPPFYWFESQEEFRAYLPGRNGARDWGVNGGVFNDCPAGVRQGPNSLPYAEKLLPGPS